MNKPWINSYDDVTPRGINYPEIPLYRFLDKSAAKFPDQPCITFQDTKYSYKTIAGLVNSFARGLVGLGIRKGDRVGLVLGNLPQFVICFYGILKAGGIVVATNPMYKERELRYQLQNSGCRFIITSSENINLIKNIQPDTEIQRIIRTDIQDYQNLYKLDRRMVSDNYSPTLTDIKLIELLCAHLEESPIDLQVKPEDDAIFQYSGGTTGIPKAAVGLHSNLVANTLQFRNWLYDLEEGNETVLVALPLYHVYGMVIAMSMGIALGANLVLIPDPRNVEDILEKIERYQATLFPGVPNMYHSINQSEVVKQGSKDLRSIKACICGSAPLLREVKNQFEKLTGGKLLEGYGLSEAPTATHCNPYMGENRTGSIGLPLPDVDCRIVSLSDGVTDLETGQVGELVIKGPQVMKGYHNMPEETELTLKDGWLYTGDIARMDADGYFYLIDRKKDVIKASGFQVWPREVEEVIIENPSILEAAVAGVIHPEKGELVRAWIVCQPGKQLSKEEIVEWCKRRLVNYKVPSEIEFVDRLPRTTVGKVLRRELVRKYLEEI